MPITSPRLASLLLLLLPLTACASPGPDYDAGPSDAAAPDAARIDAFVEIPRDPLSWPVNEPGRFRVGFRTWTLEYVPRGRTETRTTTVSCWYPTLDTTGTAARYGLVLDRSAFVDATVADPAHEGGYPVLVYSHGSRGFPGSSYPITNRFASHGWVVIAPEHPGSTLTDFSDPHPTYHYTDRSQDVSEALDSLAALPGSDPLARAVTERAVLIGHSFGTHTVWASVGATFDPALVADVCATAGDCTAEIQQVFADGVGDPRFVAGIPMAGSLRRSWFGATGHTSVTVPVLTLTGSADDVGAQAMFDTIAPVDLTWVDIEGGCHDSFGTGACGTLTTEDGTRIIGAYALAFARAHLLADTSAEVTALLDGSEVPDARAHFRRVE